MMSDQYGSCVPTSIRVEQMRVIKNLIEVKIMDQELDLANFNDGLKIQVRSNKPFTVNAFWVVKICDLHAEIAKDWAIMRDELWDNKFLNDENKCLLRNKPQIHYEFKEAVNCQITPPKSVDTSNMTITPRDFYPLVVIVTCHEEEANSLASDAAANIHIIHIRDSVVKIKTHIIKQYIKQIDGKILDISQVYSEESAACFICFEEANQDASLKLFCLLPCRHSPICSNCINRIRECPKCRCAIASVFDVNASSIDHAFGQNRPGSSIDPNLRHLYNEEGDDGEQTGARRQQGFFTSVKSMFGF